MTQKSRHTNVGFFYVRPDLMPKEWVRLVRQCVGRIVRAGGW